MNKGRVDEDNNKKNIKRHLIVIVMEVIAVGFAIILLGQYRPDKNIEADSLSNIEQARIVDETNAQASNQSQATVTTQVTSQVTGTKSISETDTKNETNTKDVSDIKNSTEPMTDEEKENLKEVNAILDNMTLEEKICQMFIVSPEELTNYNNVTAAGANTKKAIAKYHVGGVIYFSGNIKSESQIKKLLANTQAYATANNGIPMFLSVDEEGGQVARIANNSNFKVKKFGYMSKLTSKKEAYTVGDTIGTYLSDLGFNLDFAPDTDVLTNSKNTVVKDRSFSSDSKIVINYALEYAKGLNAHGVYATYKHFPGHGSTEGDTHEGFAYTNKTYKELLKSELVPFMSGIKNKIDFMMVGHISVPNVIGDNTPSSMSKVMVNDILREKLGYDGVVITDAMNMGAISKNYTIQDSTIKVVEAGCDIILMPSDFRKAYNSLLLAVKNGQIKEERIDDSVRRILLLKKRRLDF